MLIIHKKNPFFVDISNVNFSMCYVCVALEKKKFSDIRVTIKLLCTNEGVHVVVKIDWFLRTSTINERKQFFLSFYFGAFWYRNRMNQSYLSSEFFILNFTHFRLVETNLKSVFSFVKNLFSISIDTNETNRCWTKKAGSTLTFLDNQPKVLNQR